MGRQLPSGKRTLQWKGSFFVGRELAEKGASWLEDSFPMGRELSSEKRASRWEGSFLVGRELPGGKGAFSFLMGKELPGRQSGALR